MAEQEPLDEGSADLIEHLTEVAKPYRFCDAWVYGGVSGLFYPPIWQ